MDIFEAIKTRRSIGKVNDQMISKELIEKIIKAGTYAPNRYHTEPWRFFVISGEGRNKLSRVMENIVLDSGIDIESDEGKAKLEKEIARLEKMARNEKQPKKKFDIVQQIKKLRGGNGNG